MNKIINTGIRLFVGLAAFAQLGLLASCQDDYKLEIPFAVNQTALSLGASGGETVVMVYHTSGWTASLADEEDEIWATIENPNGNGNGDFTFVYTPNLGVLRSTTVNIASGTDTIQVKMTQSGFVSTAEMTLMQTALEVPATGGTFNVPLQTNLELVPYLLCPNIVYGASSNGDSDETSQQTDWIGNVVITGDNVSFDVTPNTSGKERTASMSIALKKRVGAPIANTMVITQKP